MSLDRKAIAFAIENAHVEGEHHLRWVIDQMVRILAGEDYAAAVAKAREWDEGIPP